MVVGVCVCIHVCGDCDGSFKRGQETDYTIVAQTSLDLGIFLGIFLPKLPQQIPGAAHHTRLSLWLSHHPACNIFTWTVSPKGLFVRIKRFPKEFQLSETVSIFNHLKLFLPNCPFIFCSLQDTQGSSPRGGTLALLCPAGPTLALLPPAMLSLHITLCLFPSSVVLMGPHPSGPAGFRALPHPGRGRENSVFCILNSVTSRHLIRP